MPYTFVAAGAGTDSQPATPGQPSGKAAGDLLLTLTGARTATETVNTPTGWVLLADSSPTANDSLAIFGRIATNDANDDLNFDFWSGTSNNHTRMLCFRGGGYTDLSTIVAHSGIAGAASNTADIPNAAVTITTPNCLIIGVGKKQKTATSDGATFTSPAGLDNRIFLRWAAGALVGMVADYTIQTSAANISASIWDQSIDESLHYASIILALKSVASGPLVNGPRLKSKLCGLVS